jgi:hypothetical protein
MPDATSLTGQHLIAGEWVGGGEVFRSSPATGEGAEIHSGGAAEIDRAARAAGEAFRIYGWTVREDRAARPGSMRSRKITAPHQPTIEYSSREVKG